MTTPTKTYTVEGPDLPVGPRDLIVIGHNDGCVTRFSKWPEGLVLWHDGVIVWKQWGHP